MMKHCRTVRIMARVEGCSQTYHICVGSQVNPQRKRQDLRSIGRSNGSEDTPRQTAKDFACCQNLDVRGEEGQKDKCRQDDERAEEHTLLSEDANQVTIE